MGSYDATTGTFNPASVPEAMAALRESATAQGIFTGTQEEFNQGRYGMVCYVMANRMIEQEVALTKIYDNAAEYIRTAQAVVNANNTTFYRVIDLFKSELGLSVTLNQAVAAFELAVDYDAVGGRTTQLDNSIARLIAEEVFTYGEINGDIVVPYSREGYQAIITKWRQKADITATFRITITTTNDIVESVMTEEEVQAVFLENFKNRYVWGNSIQPQRYLNEGDLSFAANVQVQVSINSGVSWSTLPVVIPYYQKAKPLLNVVDISIENVSEA